MTARYTDIFRKAFPAFLEGRPELLRFVKFCIVGASSFAVGFILFNAAYALTGHLIFSSSFAFVLSVVNGFIWNRQWTFYDKRGRPMWNQAIKFGIVNSIGYCVNLVVCVGTLALISAYENGAFDSGRFWGTVHDIVSNRAPHYSFLLINAVGIVATIAVIAWNYLANRLWSFKK